MLERLDDTPVTIGLNRSQTMTTSLDTRSSTRSIDAVPRRTIRPRDSNDTPTDQALYSTVGGTFWIAHREALLRNPVHLKPLGTTLPYL